MDKPFPRAALFHAVKVTGMLHLRHYPFKGGPGCLGEVSQVIYGMDRACLGGKGDCSNGNGE